MISALDREPSLGLSEYPEAGCYCWRLLMLKYEIVEPCQGYQCLLGSGIFSLPVHKAML